MNLLQLHGKLISVLIVNFTGLLTIRYYYCLSMLTTLMKFDIAQV